MSFCAKRHNDTFWAFQPLSQEQTLLDRQPLPDRRNHMGFLGIAFKTDLEMSDGTPAERRALIAKVQAIKTRVEARAYMESVITRAKAAKARNRR